MFVNPGIEQVDRNTGGRLWLGATALATTRGLVAAQQPLIGARFRPSSAQGEILVARLRPWNRAGRAVPLDMTIHAEHTESRE